MNTEPQSVTLIIEDGQFPPTDSQIMQGVDQAIYLIRQRLADLCIDTPTGQSFFPDPPLGYHVRLDKVGVAPDGATGFSVAFTVHHGEERTTEIDENCALWVALAWATMHECEARTFDPVLLAGWYDVDGKVQVRDTRCM